MESIRVALPSGGWWDIKSELTHGDRRRIDRKVREAAFKVMAEIEKTGLDIAKLTAGAQPAPVAWNEYEEDAHLLYCSNAWSFPGPVTAEAIEAIPDSDVNVVVARMFQQYVTTQVVAKANADLGKSLSGAA